MKANFCVTEVMTEQDLAQVLSLWERNLSIPIECGKAKYHWYYEKNPYRKGRLFLLKVKGSEKAVGVGGVGYRQFIINGEVLMGALIADLAVDRKHRTLGPALQLQRTVVQSVKKDADFLYSFPNERAEAVLKRIGYQKIERFTRLVRVLRSSPYLERTVKPRFLAKAISVPVDLLLRLSTLKSLLATGYVFHSNHFETPRSAHDSLWDRLAAKNLLVGERTSAYLDWRYFKCPNVKYEIFGVKDNDNALLGFLAYYVKEKQVQIVDLICPGYNNRTVLRALILGFERQCLSTPANSISISLIGPGKISKQLISMGYRVREPIRSVWVYSEDKDLRTKLKDVDNSYWLLGDEDNN